MVWLLVAGVGLGLAAGTLVGIAFIEERQRAVRREHAKAYAHAAVPVATGRRLPGHASQTTSARGRHAAGISRSRAHRRRGAIERHVPEMMDAIALGMSSGLSFDSSFALYHTRFDDELSQACARAQRSWETGLVTREQALASLARETGVPVMERFAGNVTRALRYGSPLGDVLDDLATQARAVYKSQLEEEMAKIPVRMLIPTAVLILPAMLIMVMGPVFLEFL
jgi:tight adherence protein C